MHMPTFSNFSLRGRVQLSSLRFVQFFLALLSVTMLAVPQAIADTPLASVEFATGLNATVFVTSPPGDTSRLFVVEQSGAIKIIRNDSVLATPFLDISSDVSFGGEQGLLGMAFHPDYSSNGYFFINYTNTAGDTRIARGRVSDDPDLANPDSLVTILSVSQPFANHNAGMLAFSPLDGYLYIGLGDGGSAGDPQNNAQDMTTLLGKMLRIDVDGAFPYAIPSDNPYVGDPGVPDEIWASGLRNPWRYSFDSESGDLYIADVGQNNFEEVDFQPAESNGGENYGWRLMEGSSCYNPSTNCDPGGLTYPIYEYSHSEGCSISGGYVYRGCAIPDLSGTYFFADYCSDRIWSFEYDGQNLTDFTERTVELDPQSGLSFQQIVSFGTDALGEMYIVDRSGRIFKIVSADTVDCNNNGRPDNCDISLGVSEDQDTNGVPDECEIYLCGDANSDQSVDVSDAVYIINYAFAGGDPPDPLEAGDVNCDGTVDVSDAVYVINYAFAGGNDPCDTDGDGELDC